MQAAMLSSEDAAVDAYYLALWEGLSDLLFGLAVDGGVSVSGHQHGTIGD